jgi:hypothetical protein
MVPRYGIWYEVRKKKKKKKEKSRKKVNLGGAQSAVHLEHRTKTRTALKPEPHQNCMQAHTFFWFLFVNKLFHTRVKKIDVFLGYFFDFFLHICFQHYMT